MALARVLRSLSRPLPGGRLPAHRRCGGGPAQLPPGGYGAWQERAARDPGAFWAEAARGSLRWDSPFHTACEAGPDGAGARWFLGGRLNVSGKAAPAPGPRGPPWRRRWWWCRAALLAFLPGSLAESAAGGSSVTAAAPRWSGTRSCGDAAPAAARGQGAGCGAGGQGGAARGAAAVQQKQLNFGKTCCFSAVSAGG